MLLVLLFLYSQQIMQSYAENIELVKDSLYEKIYKINSFDKLNENKDWIYIMYYINQDIFSNMYNDNIDKFNYSCNFLKDELLSWEDFNWERLENNKIILNIDNLEKKFKNEFSDWYEWFNNIIYFRLYVKKWDKYYAYEEIKHLYFDFTQEWKVDSVVNIIYNDNPQYFKNIDQKIADIKVKLWDKKFNKIINKISEKLKIIEEESYKKIGNILNKVNNEKDLDNNRTILFSEVKKYYFSQNIQISEVNDLLEKFLKTL